MFEKFVKILFPQQFQLECFFQSGAPRCSHPHNNPVENLVEDRTFFPCFFDIFGSKIKHYIYNITTLKRRYTKVVSKKKKKKKSQTCTQNHCAFVAFTQITNEPAHDKINKMICAPNENPGQSGHPPSLIRVFAVRIKNHWVFWLPKKHTTKTQRSLRDTSLKC